MLDKGADVLRSREKHGGTVARHAGAHDDRLAGKRSGIRGIGLEAEVYLPEIRRLAVGGGHVIGVAAVADRLHLLLGPELLQVLELRRHASHAAAGSLWLGCRLLCSRALEIRHQGPAPLRVWDT